MALTFLGLSVNISGGAGSITVPVGITNTILDPEPVINPDDPSSYELTRNYEELVDTVVGVSPTEAQAFDAIFDLIENEVVSQAADFNATGKNVEIWGRIEGIVADPDVLYADAANMSMRYYVGVTIYVTVTPL